MPYSLVALILTLTTFFHLSSGEMVRKPASIESEVSLLVDRKISELARENLIKDEKKELLISTYLFHLDDFGKRELGMLVNAAKRGVKVTLLVDGVGKNRGSRSPPFVRAQGILNALQSVGVEVKIYNPRFRRIFSVNKRSHIKTIIGSDSVIIGDRNYSSGYFRRNSSKSYLSVELLVKNGQLIEQVRNAFHALIKKPEALSPYAPLSRDRSYHAYLKEWESQAATEKTRDVKLKPFIIEDIRYVDDSLDKGNVAREVLDLIKGSRESIKIINPYIVLTPELKEALGNAVKRGVDVEVITNSKESTNVGMVGVAWEADKAELLRWGVSINETKKDYFVHAKTIIVDDEIGYVGSYNLDPRSQNINLENGIIFRDKAFASHYLKYKNRVLRWLTRQTKKAVRHNPCLNILSKILRPLLYERVTSRVYNT